MSAHHTVLWAAAAAVALSLGSGCAGKRRLADEVAAGDESLRQEIGSVRLELDAAYDRERAMAERLRRTEEELAVLQAQLTAAGERIDSLGRRPAEPAPKPAPAARVAAAAPVADVATAYRAAWALHQDHEYQAAIDAFARILEKAPAHVLADNAQYWIGESYYGLGRYREALAAFTAVLAYESTEKDDDAQLMIARSHLALGESDEAATALRQLLSRYPDSEYTTQARRELRYAEGR